MSSTPNYELRNFHAAFNANLLGGILLGFFGVKIKLVRLRSHLQQLFFGGDSHSSGVKPPKTFPFVFKMSVSVFARPSHRR
jgi:hypothetical protein